MGPLRTAGVFTKAAEATLESLKSNSSALLTILSAIVADPLYKWTIRSVDDKRQPASMNNEKKSRRGSSGRVSDASCGNDNDAEGDSKNKNEAAAHAIRKIHEKLQGYEDGTSGEQQSVEGQVSLLVNSAKDRDNLCNMFPGWAPWV